MILYDFEYVFVCASADYAKNRKQTYVCVCFSADSAKNHVFVCCFCRLFQKTYVCVCLFNIYIGIDHGQTERKRVIHRSVKIMYLLKLNMKVFTNVSADTNYLLPTFARCA